ncbi:MAG: phosphomethylpyrimidine synthase ThiC, partial [Eggerthellaceae bacterium]
MDTQQAATATESPGTAPTRPDGSPCVTQLDFARAGVITPAMRAVAEREHRDPEHIRAGVAAGRIAIPANIRHLEYGLEPRGVGEGL